MTSDAVAQLEVVRGKREAKRSMPATTVEPAVEAAVLMVALATVAI